MAHRPNRAVADQQGVGRRRTFAMTTDHGSNPRLVGIGQGGLGNSGITAHGFHQDGQWVIQIKGWQPLFPIYAAHADGQVACLDYIGAQSPSALLLIAPYATACPKKVTLYAAQGGVPKAVSVAVKCEAAQKATPYTAASKHPGGLAVPTRRPGGHGRSAVASLYGVGASRAGTTLAKTTSRFTRKGRGRGSVQATTQMPFSMSCCWDCKGCCKELPWNPYLDQDECVELCKGVCTQIGVRP